MDHNSFGHAFKITSFGESHGAALGVIIDGCPAGVVFDHDLLAADLEKRRPGFSQETSARKEPDNAQILSGVFEGKTLGTPIAIIVANQDARSQDYDAIKTQPRAGHADAAWKSKFVHVDHRGGGRSSGRETVARVMAGSVAKMLIRSLGSAITFESRLTTVGPHSFNCSPYSLDQKLQQLLEKARTDGESFGARLSVTVNGVPAGLGQPVFHKLKSELGGAILGIGAVNGVEFGAGFQAASSKGSDFHQIETGRKQYGGISGGISNGEPLEIQVSFKPASSILDVAKKGRHDPCVAVRAAIVVEAMIAIVLADQFLLTRLDNIFYTPGG